MSGDPEDSCAVVFIAVVVFLIATLSGAFAGMAAGDFLRGLGIGGLAGLILAVGGVGFAIWRS